MFYLRNTFLLLFIFTFMINAQPSAPQNLTSASIKVEYEGYTKILVKLTWDKVSDSEGNNVPLYNIYRKVGGINSSSEFQKIGQVLWNSKFNDDKVTVGETYTYYVTAQHNGESEPSNFTEVIVSDNPVEEPTTNISGNIVDESDNSPLGGVYVSAISISNLSVDVVETDSAGNFKLELLAGEYIIYFRAQQNYYSEFYNNVKHVWEATRITLVDNEPYPEQLIVGLEPIDLGNTFNLSGNVSNDEGTPLESIVSVIKMERNNHAIKNNRIRTGVDGNFSFDISEGSEIIMFANPINPEFQGEFFENSFTIADATHFYMDKDFTSVNFVLEKKIEGNSTISGKVVNQSEESVEAMVIALKMNFNGIARDNSYRTFTDDEGNYTFENLSMGDYILFAVPEEGYLPTFYNEDGLTTFKWQSADILVLDNNTNLIGIDFNLVEMPSRPENGFAEINGFVYDENETPISNAYVYAFDENKKMISYSYTDLNGEYTLDGLTPSSYTVACDVYGHSYSESDEVYTDYSQQTTVDFNLSSEIAVDIKNESNLPTSYKLNQNYPNPFNPTTIINFAVSEPGFVKLTVYDMLGQEIKTLVSKNLNIGNYNITFDASNLPNGIYVYKLSTNNFVQSKKMMLIK
ncbi:MAG: carboxypeptidase regulatory-like domain-containing protein [Melioribacteraceae bacterium]